jgi:DNA-binding transcriptional LysR family regulator
LTALNVHDAVLRLTEGHCDLLIAYHHASQPPQLETVYETDMAESLKAMALEGHGLAFLPASSVRKDLRARRLVSAGTGGGWELTMEVRIYRERPAVARGVMPMAAALWEHLRATSG